MKRYNLSNICKMAYGFIQKQGMTQSEAMRQAWMVEKLKVALKTRVVEFFYIKKSTGEMRQAFGTTDPHRYNYTATGNGRHGNYADCVQYWDFEKQAFRMFKTYNLVKVA